MSSEKVFMDALIAVLESAQGVTVEDLKRDVDALDIPLRALEASQGEGITVPPKNALETLANWIGDCAINFTGTNGMGNGAIATKDLKKGDEFIRVCKSKMITEETVERTKAGQAMLGDELCRSTPSLLLVVFLSLEMAKGSESDYAPFIGVLPRDITLPLGVSLEEVSNCEESTQKVIYRLIRATAKQYVYIASLLRRSGIAPPSWAAFRWAVAIVMSRQNRIPRSERASMMALVPGWDMCNHKHGQLATSYNLETGCLIAHVMNDTSVGDQVYIHYGERSNNDLFVYSGFVDPENTLACLSFTFDITPNDPIYGMRKLFLSKIGVSVHGGEWEQNVSLPIFHPRNSQFLFFLRTLVMTKEDATFALRNPDSVIWSQSSEISAMTLLHSRVSSMLHLCEDSKAIPNTLVGNLNKYNIELYQKILESAEEHMRYCKETYV